VHERAAIVDGDDDAAVRFRIADAEPGAERQRTMRRRQAVGVIFPAGRDARPLPVV
jgi:hypothetical protein